jgi:hypothetical protein
MVVHSEAAVGAYPAMQSARFGVEAFDRVARDLPRHG